MARTPLAPLFNRIIDEDRVILVRVVLSELIQGTKSNQDRHELQETLIALPYLEMTPHSWLLTGEMGTALRGRVLPLASQI